MIAPIRDFLARRKIRQQFAAQASPHLLQQMLLHPHDVQSAAEELELTTFSGSVHAYVGLAEQLSLAQLQDIMARYFEMCDAEIERENGFIENHVGDGTVAVFGAPLRRPDHALGACVAALRCQNRMRELRSALSAAESRYPERARNFRVRIGVHTGRALAGDMGTASRAKFAVMGENVNLTARLDPLNKKFGTWTLCTGPTRFACEHSAPGRIIFRPLEEVMMKGRLEPITLFEPVGFREDITDQLDECLRLYAAAMARWHERDWAGAATLLEQSGRLERDQPSATSGVESNPSRYYADALRAFLANPGTGRLTMPKPVRVTAAGS